MKSGQLAWVLVWMVEVVGLNDVARPSLLPELLCEPLVDVGVVAGSEPDAEAVDEDPEDEELALLLAVHELVL